MDEDRPLDQADLEALAAGGVLPEEGLSAALRQHGESRQWLEFLRKWSLVAGGALLLSGVLFFFAANWREMPRMARFGVLEAGLVLCAGLAFWRPESPVLRPAGLMGAAVFLGVLMAVFGQEYQTGADACDLFLWWAILLVPWVLVGRFLPLWLLWQVVLQTGLILYWTEVGFPTERLEAGSLFLVLGCMSLGLAAAREVLRGRMPWLRGRVWRYIAVGAGLAWLTAEPVRLIYYDEFFRSDRSPLVTVLGCFVWVGAMVASAWWFFRRDPDLGALALVLLSLCSVVVFGVIKVLGEAGIDEAALALVGGLITLGVFGGAAVLLIKLGRQLGLRGNEVAEEKGVTA